MKNWIFLVCIFLLLTSCSPVSRGRLAKTIQKAEKKFQNHIGFEIYDLHKGKNIFEYQNDQYFTPASNTKVLTLFACLSILKDSIPSIRYLSKSDSLIFWGLGDPSFLNKECFNNFRLYNFLRNASSPLYFTESNFSTTHLGVGWSWDDYNDYYSAERSPLSIYGNTFSFFPFPDNVLVSPEIFGRYFNKGEVHEKTEVIRQQNSNGFVFHPGKQQRFKEFKIPFHADSYLTGELLQDTLKRKVTVLKRPLDPTAQILYSTPADSVYRVMMQESDNHIAEQLLLNCAAALSDSLKPEIAIKFIQDKYFVNFQDQPVWVDGSGLSRYNLFTPRFMVELWREIYRTVPEQRLFPLLAIGGRPGTLQNWYNQGEPYLFGKTGTLSNNHCLSGFLVTKTGKKLAFAFMNANYVTTTQEIRMEMQRILNLFYENY